MMACTQSAHTKCDPDVCFTAKLRYWRDEPGAGLSFGFTEGKDTFHNSESLGSRERQAIADARSVGINPERATS